MFSFWKKTFYYLGLPMLVVVLCLPLLAPQNAQGQNAGGKDNLSLFFAEAENAENREFSKNHIALTYIAVDDAGQAVVVDPGRAYQRIHLGAPDVGILDDPAIIFWSDAETDFFAFIRGADDALWYVDGAGKWQSLGGVLSSSPDAALLDGKVAVFVRGADMEIYHRFYDLADEEWTEWESIQGPIFGADSAPAAFGWEVEPDDYILGGVMVRRTVGTLSWILLTRDGWTTWTNIVGPYYIKANIDIDVTTANYLNMIIASVGRDDLIYTLHINVSLQGDWHTVTETAIAHNPSIAMFSDDWYRLIYTYTNDDRLLEVTCQTPVRPCGSNITWSNRGSQAGSDAYAWGD